MWSLTSFVVLSVMSRFVTSLLRKRERAGCFTFIVLAVVLLSVFFVSSSRCNEYDLPCADPESFVRGGPTLTTFLVDEGREDQSTTISGSLLVRQRNAFKWRADDGLTLNAIFQGIRTCIARKPYIFVICKGVGDPCPCFWFRAWSTVCNCGISCTHLHFSCKKRFILGIYFFTLHWYWSRNLR